MPDHRSHERDRRLRRVNQITGATLAGGIALTAGWSVAAAHTSAGAPSVPPAQAAVAGSGTQTPTTGATQAPAATQQQAPATAAQAPTVAPDQQQTQTQTQQQAQPDTQQTSPPITSARRRHDKQSAPVSGGS